MKEGNLSRLVSFPLYSLKIELFIYGTFSRPIGANARGFKSRGISPVDADSIPLYSVNCQFISKRVYQTIFQIMFVGPPHQK